jgi:hypothetical protein
MEAGTIKRSNYFSLDYRFVVRVKDPTTTTTKDELIVTADRLKQKG